MGHLYEFFIRSEINLAPVPNVTQRRYTLLNGIAAVGMVLLRFFAARRKRTLLFVAKSARK
jgi:hypothetical protein